MLAFAPANFVGTLSDPSKPVLTVDDLTVALFGVAVLLGDFNCEPSGPEYPLLVGPLDDSYGRVGYQDAFVDAWCAAGHEEDGCITWIPTAEKVNERERRLDYCFLSPSLAPAVQRAWVDLDAQGSDHQPCWFELAF